MTRLRTSIFLTDLLPGPLPKKMRSTTLLIQMRHSPNPSPCKCTPSSSALSYLDVYAGYYSIPCAKIITRPGSTSTSSLMCALSQLSTRTACFPANQMSVRLHYVTYSPCPFFAHLESGDRRNYHRSSYCSASSPANSTPGASDARGSSPSGRPVCAVDNLTRTVLA